MACVKGLSHGVHAAAAVAACLALAAPAAADTFKPTRFDDPAPGPCKAKDCSLREAVLAANADSNTSSIVLERGTYELEIAPVGGDLGPDNGDLGIGYPATLKGKGRRATRIDANGLDRVLFIGDDISGERTTIRSLEITGGDPTALSDPDQVPLGGGIWMYTGKVLLRDVVITGNEAQFGGGIRAQSTGLKIRDSTIAGNNAGEGGGIQTANRVFDPAVTKIVSSTISGNFANKGGGILADGFTSSPTPQPPQVSLLNSTVARNHAANEGGGIMADNSAIVSMDNTTVARNIANEDNAGSAVAGGIHQHSGATFTVDDSVVASNTIGTGGTDPDCNGTFAGSGNVLIAASGCASLLPGPNLFVGSALVGPLAKNGGPTKTLKLKPGSPALGFAVTCPGRDQRGVARTDNCDSGAYERPGP